MQIKINPSIIVIWSINCVLWMSIAIQQIWIPYMSAYQDSYTSIKSDNFNWTIAPIAYVPNYQNAINADKLKTFDQYNITDFIPTPKYDTLLLENTSLTNKDVFMQKYIYITPYMGSYRMNYKEFDGSHLWVDIRAPIGTPVLSIANWVVIRTIDGDSTWAKHIVIRHDNVPYNGKIVTLYSVYTHLSEIVIWEWVKVRKWDFIGRVGMSWIATTPHLHFQIETNDAPSHPYWPYTSKDAKNAGVNWFDAINIGLGKENALKYSIHPLKFIQNESVSITKNTKQPIIASITTIIDNQNCNRIFSDVPKQSSLWKFLYPLTERYCIYNEKWDFSPKTQISKKEALMVLMKYLNIEPRSWDISPMLDVQVSDNLHWYLLKALQLWIIEWVYFQPDNTITRGEMIDLLMKLSRKSDNISNTSLVIYTDIPKDYPHIQNINNYAKVIHAKWGRFYPTNIITRQELIKILSTFEAYR